MAAYRPKSLDELNNQYDKVKSADQAIKQGQSRLEADKAAGHGTQRVTWNYDPAKYRVSKEEAAALTGSVDRFIKEFSARPKPQASALELAQEALASTEQAQPQLQEETVAAFDALLERAKAETAHAVQQAQTEPQAHRPAAPIDAASAESEPHHGVYQSDEAPVKEGELSGLMDEYMRVMNDEDENERGGRFRRRRKERKRAKGAAADNVQPAAQSVPQPPAVPFVAPAPAPEPELPQDFLAPEMDFEIPEEVVAPIEDTFDVPEEVVAPVEDAFDVPEEVVAPVEDTFDVPEEVVAPVEDTFDVPEEVDAPEEDEFDIPEEVVAPVEDTFDIPEEVAAPVEDAFDIPEEVVVPVEDAFDVPEEVAAPVEDAFDVPEEVVEPVEDASDVPEEVVAPVEDAFDVPEEVAAPVEDAFDAPEEVVAPEEDTFDVPEEVVVPVEDAFDVPEEDSAFAEDACDNGEDTAFPAEEAAEDLPTEVYADAEETPAPEEAEAPAEESEMDDFVFPEEFLMPVIEPEEAGAPVAEDAGAEDAFEESAEEIVIPVEEPSEDTQTLAADEEPFGSADEAAEETAEERIPEKEAVVAPELLFPEELPPENAETEAPQTVEAPETEEVFSDAPAYPVQFEDVQSYSTDAGPEDRFVPLEDLPQQAAETAENAPEEGPEPSLDPQEESAQAAQDVPAAPAKRKKEHRFLRGLGKFFCSIFLIVSLLATLCVVLLGTVLGINSGTPTIGDYYLFTASNTYEGTAVDKGDLVLCQQTTAVPNDTGVVYIDEQSHSFSFGVKRSDRIDSATNTLVYDVSGTTVSKENLLGTVVQTLPSVGIYARYIIDHFVPLVSGCGALVVLWILLLILLSHRKRDVYETEEDPSAAPDELSGDIG